MASSGVRLGRRAGRGRKFTHLAQRGLAAPIASGARSTRAMAAVPAAASLVRMPQPESTALKKLAWVF